MDLKTAIEVSYKGHGGQTRFDGSPYILHPLRVMASVNTDSLNSLDSDLLRQAAVMHDVVEDTKVSLEDLMAMQFDARVINWVDILTKKSGVVYEDYIQAVSKNHYTARIKVADIKDNSDVSVVPYHKRAWFDRKLQKYNEALKLLEEQLIDII